jgi:sugar O-acyltransferase (sialic acid O-acetyltransferase NeuD family)
MIDLVILGAAGTAIDVLDFIDDINRREATYRCIGLLDDDPHKSGIDIAGVRVVGPLSHARQLNDVRFVDALGSPSSFRRRPEIVARTGIAAHRFESIVHPSASVSRRSTLGRGAIIYPHVTIGANVTLGDHVTVLANSVLNHDCRIGDYTIITSGVCLSGRVTVGRACYMGTGSHVIQDATIGDRAMVGMGSTVIRDVKPDSVVVGVPAHALDTSEKLT